MFLPLCRKCLYFFFLEYQKRDAQQDTRTTDQCDYDRPPQPGKVCKVNIHDLYPCTPDNDYNFQHSGPCIFLKLNKVFSKIDFYSQ